MCMPYYAYLGILCPDCRFHIRHIKPKCEGQDIARRIRVREQEEAHKLLQRLLLDGFASSVWHSCAFAPFDLRQLHAG